MGIDLENYRQKIGTFVSYSRKYKFKGGKNKRQLEYFMKQASKFRRKEINTWDVLMGLTFYIVTFIIISGRLENQKITSFQNNLSVDENLVSFKNQSNSMFLWMTIKQINKACHIMEGNKRNPGYKYFSWNCDRGFLSEHKLDDLKCFAFRNKPHVISVSEVNLVRNEQNNNEKSTNQFSTEQV